jgi:Ser/Thr protein kinase RdoA (MazF antagonist)
VTDFPRLNRAKPRSYDKLTKKGQARRVRRLAEVALREFGFRQYRLRLLKHLVNTTFALACDTDRYLVRVHRVKDHTPLRIESELAWIEALSHDTAVSVQTPYRSPDDRMIVVADAPGVLESYPVTVLSWLKGRILPQDRRTLRHFEHLGRLVANLHNHSRTWTLPPTFDRPTYDTDGTIGPRSGFPIDEIGRERLPAPVLRDLETVYSRLKKVEEHLGHDPEHFGLIHFDLSFTNVLFAAEEAMPIDFDQCGFGFYLYDLAVVLAGPYGEPGFQERCAALFRGYRNIRHLDGDLIAYIPVFMASRATTLILWAAAQSPHHPWIETQWKHRIQPLLNVDINQFST